MHLHRTRELEGTRRVLLYCIFFLRNTGFSKPLGVQSPFTESHFLRLHSKVYNLHQTDLQLKKDTSGEVLLLVWKRFAWFFFQILMLWNECTRWRKVLEWKWKQFINWYQNGAFWSTLAVAVSHQWREFAVLRWKMRWGYLWYNLIFDLLNTCYFLEKSSKG